jgi:hypothetical protein
MRVYEQQVHRLPSYIQGAPIESESASSRPRSAGHARFGRRSRARTRGTRRDVRRALLGPREGSREAWASVRVSRSSSYRALSLSARSSRRAARARGWIKLRPPTRELPRSTQSFWTAKGIAAAIPRKRPSTSLPTWASTGGPPSMWSPRSMRPPVRRVSRRISSRMTASSTRSTHPR